MNCDFSNILNQSINSKWNSEVVVLECKKCSNKSVMSHICKDRTCLYCGSSELVNIN